MKILQEKSREYNGKPYFKFKINLPEDLLEKSGFQPGDELEAEAKKGEIKLRRKWKTIYLQIFTFLAV